MLILSESLSLCTASEHEVAALKGNNKTPGAPPAAAKEDDINTQDEAEVPEYPLGGLLFRNDMAVQQILQENNRRQFSPIKINDLLFMIVHWSHTQPDVEIFQHAVFRMITHPVRPRSLLRGEMVPEDAVAEFLSAVVIKVPPVPQCPSASVP